MSGPPVILNVEDTLESRQLVRRVLESEGYRVIDAVNALEGIEQAIKVQPDLILMDINLPDLDGFTAVTRIRGYLRTVPIIAVTARNASHDRERALAIGCDGYLNKPIDIDQLTAEITHYLVVGHSISEDTTQREFYLNEQNLALIAELEYKLAELQTAYDRLKHLDQAKTNFIALASHELRTPLTIIHSYIQMLETLPSVQSDDVAREMLGKVAKGSTRLRELIEDMVRKIRVELTEKNFDSSRRQPALSKSG
ncbi:MAG TPA: response regulator [Anaerolineae bacterium]